MRALDLPAGTTVGSRGRIEEARETQRRLGVATGAPLRSCCCFWCARSGGRARSRWSSRRCPSPLPAASIALWLAGETWNASSIVGLIGLFGVAVQNSLVLISQTRELLARGEPLRGGVARGVDRPRAAEADDRGRGDPWAAADAVRASAGRSSNGRSRS